MKALFLSLAFIACAGLAASQESVWAPLDLSGFSGYAWGASYEYIQDTMTGEDYELLSSGVNDLWYSGEIWGTPLNLVYYFDGEGQLIGGAWLLAYTDESFFWWFNEQLRKTYNAEASVSYMEGVFIRSKMTPPGTDALIEHELNLKDLESRFAHTVRYKFQPSGEE